MLTFFIWYFIMEIIKFNEKKIIQKHLLSLSIFKIIGPYRDFSKYIFGLDRVLNHTYNNKNNFDVRVYFDDSCFTEIKPLMNKYKNVEFYKFNYPPLRIGEFHNGTFGSLTRLLPLFDRSPYDIAQYQYIWIDDIDILPKNLDLNIINRIELKGFDTYFSSLFCYFRPWFKHKHNYNLNFPLITNIRLNYNIFSKFLDDLVNNKYKDVIDEILKYRMDRYKYDYQVKHPYGMDEYFTNNILYNHLIKYKTYISYQTDVSSLLKSISFIKGIDKNNQEIIKSLLDLQNIAYKASDLKILRNINNTFIKLFKKIDKNKLYPLIDDNKKKCINEYIVFLNKYDMKDINDFKYIIKIN